MNSLTRVFKLTVLATSLASGAAFADGGTLADRTHAELIAAQKSGDVVLYLGKTGRELFPNLYPENVRAQNEKTTEQVRAELLEAQKSGDIVDYLGMTDREIFPNRYAKSGTEEVGKTRAQIRSELVEAQKAGNVVAFFGKTVREVNSGSN